MTALNDVLGSNNILSGNVISGILDGNKTNIVGGVLGGIGVNILGGNSYKLGTRHWTGPPGARAAPRPPVAIKGGAPGSNMARRGIGPWSQAAHVRMLTARAATRAMVSSEIIASAIISSLARGVSGTVSVGENAVALVNARNR